MSRIIIRNLPKKISAEKVQQIFSKIGDDPLEITDVQLKYTDDGEFRQFAFIGFTHESGAQKAIEYYDNTYIATNRIRVEVCHSLGSTPSKKKKPQEKQQPLGKTSADAMAKLLAKHKDDPMFAEFLQLHSAADVSEISKNADNDSDNQDDSESEDVSFQKQGDKDDDSKGETETDTRVTQINKKKKKPKNITIFLLKLTGLPKKAKKKDIKDFFKPLSLFTVRINRKMRSMAYVGFKREQDMKKALHKDRSFIDGHRIFVHQYTAEDVDGGKNGENPKTKQQEESIENSEHVAESGVIFFRNLAYNTTEDDIRQLFSKYGDLADVELPLDPSIGRIKGYGTVTFLLPENAVRAFTELDGSVFRGRMLHLLPGKEKKKDEEIEDGTSNYKKKKEAKQKLLRNSWHNWNSLFLGANAVAEVLADTHKISKRELELPEDGGTSGVVKLALGETQIVSQTRKFLEKEGVNLDAFHDSNKRSNTIILVKNLPAGTQVEEIRELCGKHGTISRLILPPSGLTAVVEFVAPDQAKKAFLHLAYSRFKSTMLFLEWAPENSFKESATTIPQIKDKQKNYTSTEKDDLDESKHVIRSEKTKEEQVCDGKQLGDGEDNEEEPEPDTTLYVKNLNFKTTDADLRAHFESCGKISYATVTRKKDTKQNMLLSMGYGFVRFYKKKDADKALKNLQQTVLDGKSIELKRSDRTLRNEVTRSAKRTSKKTRQTGTKILVKNIPFEAKQEEIQQLFETFGEVKGLRLPKKMSDQDAQHRGFAFVDYVSPSDAKHPEAAPGRGNTHTTFFVPCGLEWINQQITMTTANSRAQFSCGPM